MLTVGFHAIIWLFFIHFKQNLWGVLLISKHMFSMKMTSGASGISYAHDKCQKFISLAY